MFGEGRRCLLLLNSLKKISKACAGQDVLQERKSIWDKFINKKTINHNAQLKILFVD